MCFSTCVSALSICSCLLLLLLPLPPITAKLEEQTQEIGGWSAGTESEVWSFSAVVSIWRRFSHLPAVCFYIIGVLQSFLKGVIQSICASLCALHAVFSSAAAQHSPPPVWTPPLFNNSIKLHDYRSNDAKQTGDNNIFIALAARQCHPSLRMMPHDIVYHVYQPWSLQT